MLIPLHNAAGGQKYARFSGEDKYTTRESERLIRLPMYYAISDEQVEGVVDLIKDYSWG